MRNDAGDKRIEARIRSGLPFSYRKHWLTDVYSKNRFGFKSDFIFFFVIKSPLIIAEETILNFCKRKEIIMEKKFYLGSMVIVIVVSFLLVMTGCGKDNKSKTTESSSNDKTSSYEIEKIQTETIVMSDGLEWTPVSFTLALSEDFEEGSKGYKDWVESFYKKKYQLTNEEWEYLLENREITIACSREIEWD